MEFIIHEFSTGITPEGNEQQWVSKGFTGRYMNMTMNVVPSVVERVIANHGFAVAEGTSSEQPAIIGRAVVGPSEQESWSVIAFVTRGQDEYGRSFGFHRYFLCQGINNLWMLIEWLEAYRLHKGHYPVFNPFKLRQPAQPNRWETPQRVEMSIDAPQWIYEKTPAIAPWHELLSMAEINDLAEQKANGQPEQITWALDVEALEQPERFLIIKPASARAAEILQQPVAMSTQSLSTYTTIDEAAIKGAIKGLINSNQVNKSLFETLIISIRVVKNELESNISVNKYWNDIFDKQGAFNALSQNISSPQMNRLLALRAIIIPETLYQYLQWLNIEKANNSTSKSSESLDFQQQLKLIAKDLQLYNPEIFTDFVNNLIEGIKCLLYKLYKENTTKETIKKLSLESEIWVLKSRDGIWSFCKESFQKMIVEDLQCTKGKSNNYKLNGKEWEIIWHDVRRYRNNQNIICFLPFAELFAAIGNPALAACFYQLAKGEVPANIYKKTSFRHGFQPFGIQIIKAQTSFEKFTEIALPVTAVIIGISIAGGFGFLIYNLIHIWSDSQNYKAQNNMSQTGVSSGPSEKSVNLEDVLKNIKTKPDVYSKAQNSFEETKNSRDIIINQIYKQNSNQDLKKIKSKLNEVLFLGIEKKRETTLNIEINVPKTKEGKLAKEKDDLISLIYHYQTQHDLKDKDGILSKPKTKENRYENPATGNPPSTGWCLINDVKKKLNLQSSICNTLNDSNPSPTKSSSSPKTTSNPGQKGN